jgi:1-deoxy-D-xylulose-5-phosphate synthase
MASEQSTVRKDRQRRPKKRNRSRSSKRSRSHNNARVALLPCINSPADIKKMSLTELERLSREIRDRIVEVVAQNGGHLAPNLGVVELTLALHYVFDTPQDKIVWDVGHQCYTHKLITGRREQFHTIRQCGGISGFPRTDESPYDCFNTGHASTSLSAALGMAVARDLWGQDFKVVAVIGDGALTGGMALEGLNQAGHLKKDLIVVLNDNKMSISENVGALSEYLNRLQLAPVYNRLKTDVWELLGKLPPSLGHRARDAARRVREGLKNLVVPTILFEELGFRYIGPLDSHNLGELIETFRAVRAFHGPVLVHVLSQKGRGYTPAEGDPSRFHGLGSFDVKTGNSLSSGGPPTYTEVFGKTLVELAREDPRVVAITAAMPDGTGLIHFAREFPERFFDVGICEQHAVTFATALAQSGLRPVVAIYSTFLQRAFDQVIHDTCLQNLPVVFCLDRGGVVGEDGPTHHGTFDLSYLRFVPNLVIMAPKDEIELRDMLKTAIEYEQGPIAVRYPRDRCLGLQKAERFNAISIGRAELLRKGRDAVAVAIGSMVPVAMRAAEQLAERGIDLAVVNARFVRPLDVALLTKLFSSIKRVITLEENVLAGGFGAGVMEMAEQEDIEGLHFLRVGLPDKFVEHGARPVLLAREGLDVESVTERIARWLAELPSDLATVSPASHPNRST